MNVYLLVDKTTGEVVGIYKYEAVALIAANRPTLKGSILEAFQGKSQNKYRVEVHKVIE